MIVAVFLWTVAALFCRLNQAGKVCSGDINMPKDPKLSHFYTLEQGKVLITVASIMIFLLPGTYYLEEFISPVEKVEKPITGNDEE